jgi:hypothetical protein
MTDILNRILARKAEEIAERQAKLPLAELTARIAELPGTRADLPPPSRRRSPPACRR